MIFVVVLISVGVILTNNSLDKRNLTPVEVLYEQDIDNINFNRGGGVISQPDENTDIQTIQSFSACTSDSDCDSPSPHTNNVVLHWEVNNGVGCCNTYNCNYDLFEQNCLEPFTLYTVVMDEEIIPMNLETYDYTCSQTTPYNYFSINNVSVGVHEILLQQKDCNEIVDEKIMILELQNIDDTYILSQTVEEI